MVYRYSANNVSQSAEVRVSQASYGKLGELPEGSPIRVTYSRHDPSVSRLTDYSSTRDYVTYIYALFAVEGAVRNRPRLLNRHKSNKQRELSSD